MEMLHGCQFKNIHFLDRDTLWKRFDNGTSMALQMKEKRKKIQIPSTESKVPLYKLLIWHLTIIIKLRSYYY